MNELLTQDARPLTRQELESVRALLPAYDALPDLLTPKEVSQYIRIDEGVLANDRVGAQNIRIRFKKVGGGTRGRIRYFKTSMARYLLGM